MDLGAGLRDTRRADQVKHRLIFEGYLAVYPDQPPVPLPVGKGLLLVDADCHPRSPFRPWKLPSLGDGPPWVPLEPAPAGRPQRRCRQRGPLEHNNKGWPGKASPQCWALCLLADTPARLENRTWQPQTTGPRWPCPIYVVSASRSLIAPGVITGEKKGASRTESPAVCRRSPPFTLRMPSSASGKPVYAFRGRCQGQSERSKLLLCFFQPVDPGQRGCCSHRVRLASTPRMCYSPGAQGEHPSVFPELSPTSMAV